MFTAAKLFQAGEGEEANNLIEELIVNQIFCILKK